MSKIDVVLCNPVRTAIGTYDGALKNVPAPDLGAAAIRESLARSGLAADKVQSLRPARPVSQRGCRWKFLPWPSTASAAPVLRLSPVLRLKSGQA